MRIMAMKCRVNPPPASLFHDFGVYEKYSVDLIYIKSDEWRFNLK
jgi:hypothetical protein